MVVDELMTTNVLTVSEKETLKLADAEMRLGNFRHLPVMDEKQHVVGVLSDRDVLRALKRHSSDLPVGQIMTRHVHTVRTGTPAERAATIMMERGVGALPVIGDGEVLVGILTVSDFLQIARDALAAHGTSRSHPE